MAAELTGLLEPFSEPIVVELRQREDEVRLPGVARAYVVHPFEPPSGSWLGLYNTLLRQPAPCLSGELNPPLLPIPRARQALGQAGQAEDGDAKQGKHQDRGEGQQGPDVSEPWRPGRASPAASQLPTASPRPADRARW